ncbi:MAG: hypothetical protein QGI21_03485 [Candidatus Poseidoniaceae archaeon]|jgi:hypothetical protein|nr:hypothetical protein [Candidatus Poseidoniaceae archaeon]
MEHAPWKIFHNGDVEIMIDVDGGINVEDIRYCPFPTSITHASLTDDGLICTWVDHDLRIARMALLNISNLENGISKSTLRKTHNSAEVANAEWCHKLDAEPLALASNGPQICFALWTRGIYCIETDSTEVWRSPILPEEGIPRSEEIAYLNIVDEKLHVWTRGACHLTLSMTDGKEISKSYLEIEADIDAVFNAGNEFLLTSRDGWCWLIVDDEMKIAQQLRGTIQHAIHDGEKWRMISWRDDLILGGDKITKDDLGVQIVNINNEWMVIDNQGRYSPHMGGN